MLSVPSVLVRDFAGAPVSGVSVTFTVAQGSGSVTGATSLTNASGIATIGSWTIGATPLATNSLTASAGGLTAPFTAVGTSSATNISIVSGNNQVVPAYAAAIAPLKVLVTGAGSSPVQGISVLFTVSTSGGMLGPTNYSGGTETYSALTDASGVATAVWIASGTLGSPTLSAATSGLAPVTFAGSIVNYGQGYARCELSSAGAAYCWGDNGRGQIGDGTTVNRGVPTLVSGERTFTSLAEGSADHDEQTGLTHDWGAKESSPDFH